MVRRWLCSRWVITIDRLYTPSSLNWGFYRRISWESRWVDQFPIYLIFSSLSSKHAPIEINLIPRWLYVPIFWIRYKALIQFPFTNFPYLQHIHNTIPTSKLAKLNWLEFNKPCFNNALAISIFKRPISLCKQICMLQFTINLCHKEYLIPHAHKF